MQGHEGYVSDAVMSRDCSRVITVSGDTTGAIWEVRGTGAGARPADSQVLELLDDLMDVNVAPG